MIQVVSTHLQLICKGMQLKRCKVAILKFESDVNSMLNKFK